MQYTMADTADIHPTDGRRRREKGPPSSLALPQLERVSDTERGHSEDSAGEKEAKRQRSNPGTPVSTPRRMPYDYDAVMGITRVGTREAKGLMRIWIPRSTMMPMIQQKRQLGKKKLKLIHQCRSQRGSKGVTVSSSLKECIEFVKYYHQNCPCSTRLWGR